MPTDPVIRIMCPNLKCRCVLAVPAEARGRLVRCRQCGANILIPKKKADAAPSTTGDAQPAGEADDNAAAA